MPSLLAKRIEALEQMMGAGAQVAVGLECSSCGGVMALAAEGRGSCQAHRPLPPAEIVLVVRFVAPARS